MIRYLRIQIKQIVVRLKLEKMSKYWSLPQEIYRAFHQWPVILVFCLLGGLLGFGVSRVWPASYRATANLYVALNPYRAFEDSEFLAQVNPQYSNLDDYKNWQMSQLQAVIYLDEIIEESLARLQERDEFWLQADSDKLRSMLSSNWRSPGRWSLISQGNNRLNTRQAAKVWSQVVLERVSGAITAARLTVMLDSELQAVIQELEQTRSARNEVNLRKRMLSNLAVEIEEFDQNLPLQGGEQERAVQIIFQIIDSNPTEISIPASVPAPGARAGEYLDWINSIIAAFETEKQILEEQIQYLETERNRLEENYKEASEDSLGLSPNLEIEPLEFIPSQLSRSTSLQVLIGSILGLLAWLFWALVRITLRTRENIGTDADQLGS